MADWITTPEMAKREARRRLIAGHLMCCPLCETVNALENEECFQCGWHGQFEHDPRRVEAALDDLVLSCPELLGVIFAPGTEPAPPKKTFLQKIFGKLKGLFFRRKRLDFRI